MPQHELVAVAIRPGATALAGRAKHAYEDVGMGRGLDRIHTQVIANFHIAIDRTDQFLGELLLIERGHSAAQANRVFVFFVELDLNEAEAGITAGRERRGDARTDIFHRGTNHP